MAIPREHEPAPEAVPVASPLAVARWVWLPLLLFSITRLGIALVAYLAVPLIADAPSPPYHLRPPGNVLVDALGSRWDTGFYVSIAEEGYQFEGVSLPSVAFFPLLPLLMRAVTPLTGDTLLAGIVISNVALLLAMMLFYRLVAESWDEQVAERAVWYLLIFPTAFFGMAIYTESLFLLAAIGAFYFARRSYWELAALLGVTAGLSRLTGLIVIPMLLLEWLRQWQVADGGKRPFFLSFLAPFTPLIGLGAFMLYLQRLFGDPLAFLHGAQAWERGPLSPWLMVAELLQRPAEGWGRALLAGQLHLDNWIDFGAVLLFLVLGAALLAKQRWSEGAFVLLGTLLPLSSGLLMSQRRYVWVLFPAFILLAQWSNRRPWLDKTITALFLLGLALFTALFVNGYWVG
jgi:Gpi18-like mannosyltransferase